MESRLTLQKDEEAILTKGKAHPTNYAQSFSLGWANVVLLLYFSLLVIFPLPYRLIVTSIQYCTVYGRKSLTTWWADQGLP